MIVARVRMTGTTLRQLSIANGFKPDSLYQALQKPWPNAERIIAAAIGVEAAEIWPSRYPDSVSETGMGTRIDECARAVGGKRALAKQTGIPEPTLYDYISQKSSPTAERLVKIAGAADRSIDWLATGSTSSTNRGAA